MKTEWQTKTLAEICQIKPPKSEARNKFSGDAPVSFVPMENLGIDRKYFNATQTKTLAEVIGSYTYFAEGDVLLAKITPCFENGKLGIARNLTNGIGFGSSEYVVLRPNKNLSSDWLYYFLAQESFRDEGARSMTGAVGHKRVAKEFIDEYPIPIPPLSEQQRIVRILDEAFEGIAAAKANAEKNLTNARALLESCIEITFAQGCVKWDKKSLVEICSLFFDSAHRTPKYEQDGIPALRPRDVVGGFLNLSSVARVSEEEYIVQSKRYNPSVGDIVYSRELSYGWAALVPESPRVCLSQGMCVFRPGDRIDTKFLLYVLNGPIGREQAIQAAVGAAHPHINLGDIKSYKIPLPSISEQKQLTKHFDAVSAENQRLEAIYKQKIAALDELKKALLHQAFAGEL